MHDDRAQLETHIRKVRQEWVRPSIHAPSLPLAVRAHHVAGEPIPIEQARAAPFEPFALGDPWGPPWGTTWFAFDAEVPADWAGRRVEALIAFAPVGMVGFGAEALVWSQEGPVQGLHPDHQRVVVAERAAGGEAVSLLVEAAANPDLALGFAPTPLGDRATAGDTAGYRLVRAELACCNTEIEVLERELSVLLGIVSTRAPDDPRAAQIFDAVVRSIDRLDPRDVAGTAEAARAELVAVLGAPAPASAPEVTAIGHAHIDTAWLWPLRETRRKCARTFSTAVMLMDEFDEYRFGCSQAQQYAWIEEDHPELFARIRDKVSAGQWVPLGGMWVEADTNIPSGESLVRQLVHGQRYFRERFGVTCEEVWIPDVFGYSAALPQIMRQAGCRRLVTQKLSWNDTNRFPHHTFWWEGLDGSRVLAHFPPADTYNGEMKPAELVRGSAAMRDHVRVPHSLYLFGHGDGGGGPTREMLERARLMRDLEGVPRVTLDGPGRFFDAVEGLSGHPRWVGELYLEKHRGTLTSQAATKAGNRRAELALREAELWAAFADVSYPAEQLDGLWKRLLTQQFHDILPGTAIAWVHRETERELSQVARDADAIAASALESIARTIGEGSDRAGRTVLANACTHERAEVIETAAPLEGVGLRQPLAGGRSAVFVRVPGLSVAGGVGLDPDDAVEVSGDRLENSRVRITWDDDGILASVLHKAREREALAGPANVLQLFADHPNEFDAWDVDRATLASFETITDLESMTVLDEGPLVGRVRIERAFGDSRIVQDLILRAQSARLDIVTRVDWHERERLLKAAFPVAVRTMRAAYEMQFGHVERSTHENTSWDRAQFEVCGHTWADCSEPDFGVAILNDAKYGYDVAANVMRLTLLRAPRFPDPNTDQGHHEFTYSLLVHDGDLRRGDVVAEAHRLNSPIRVIGASHQATVAGAAPATGDLEQQVARQLVRIDHPGVVVSAVKRADDGSGDLIVRCYESWGQQARFTVALDAPIAVARACDLHEEPHTDLAVDAGAAVVELAPFELVTIRAGT